MDTDKTKKSFEKPQVDEALLMDIMSGEKVVSGSKDSEQHLVNNETKSYAKRNEPITKKLNYEEIFLANRYPSGRNGKVVYIRPEYHERLMRLVQLTKEERTTLYSYIDNILEQHFKEFGTEIKEFFNERNKPIL